MAGVVRGVYPLTLSVCLFIYFGLVVCVSAARSSSRGGSRSSSRSSGRHRSDSSGLTATNAGLAAGLYYGSSLYMSRRMYHSGEHEPTVCVNYNDTDTNGTVYGQFICPMASHPEHYTYCCGEEEQERCCGFWDNVGRIIAVVVGSLIGVGILGGLICFVVFKGWKTNGSVRTPTPNQIVMQNRARRATSNPEMKATTFQQAVSGIAGTQGAYPLQSTAPPYPATTDPSTSQPPMPPPPPSYEMAMRQGASPSAASAASYHDAPSTDTTLPYPVNTPHQRSGYPSS